MFKFLLLFSSLFLLQSAQADDCSTCRKMDELAKSHQSIKKENADTIEDSVDRAVQFADSFKFSGDKKKRKQEVKSLVNMLASVNKDDKMGSAAELLDYFSRKYPNSAIRKEFNLAIDALAEPLRGEILKAIEHARKVKAKGNG